MSNKHIGRNVESWLEEEGILEAVNDEVKLRVGGEINIGCFLVTCDPTGKVVTMKIKGTDKTIVLTEHKHKVEITTEANDRQTLTMSIQKED